MEGYKGVLCPSCASGRDKTTFGELEWRDTFAVIEGYCFNCGAEWQDHYRYENTVITKSGKEK